MPVTLTTARLLLRPWIDDDVDFILDMYSRWEVQRFIGLTPRVMTERHEAEQRLQAWKAFEDPVLGIWAVTTHDGARAGTLLLKPIPASAPTTPLPPSGDIEIGWHFHPDAWGHGYASEAAARVLQHAFDSGLQQVVAVTNPANTASQAVARRIGMAHRGTTDRYYGTTCELFVAEAPA
ncbi:Protein N-acetyltransferase, RimJ/RimL family [Quadrisphaera granulorum]|uniref:RimJ/RimL family protein N-acetyltransferase n=1 Tax=Quadrisphaera granulorum TaxID=317664 RepID=A0A316AWS1_9ACTN|nr:GNAT family N-acetyltransferase [Quadrisphaera granulorum]PWJ54617.1 RimJ/RimL family protein N-acetyltransferase [Quadrisphaera granulorum]SZE95979.1 Protein N-acetyltransferase, RimJ/RimL family [Quadrisphaera granulorum]